MALVSIFDYWRPFDFKNTFLEVQIKEGKIIFIANSELIAGVVVRQRPL